MRTFLNSILCGAVLLTAATASAVRTFGPSSGGGGFVVNCAATILEPAKLELLDLYEGQNKLNFVMAVGAGDLTQDYFAGVQRTYTLQGAPGLAQERRVEIEQNLKNFFRAVKFVNSATEMPQAHDLGNVPWIPASCQVQQVAFFDDMSEVIYIDQQLFQKMDTLNQAALVHHELMYRLLRGFDDTTSELSRLAVAHAFAVRGVTPLDDGILKNSPQHFTSSYSANSSDEISSFRAFPLAQFGQPILRLQFSHLQGRPQLTKTWIDLPWNPWDLKFGRSQSQPNIVACIVQTPNVNIQYTAPVNGTMSVDMSIRYTYKTGEPIGLALLRNGKVLSEAYVSTNCPATK